MIAQGLFLGKHLTIITFDKVSRVAQSQLKNIFKYNFL